MSHFAEGVLQAYLDDEVAADARVQVNAHVGECAVCAARLQDLRELGAAFSTAVESADITPIPMAALAELRVRAGQYSWRERMRGARRQFRRAAIVVIGVTAAGVAAVPGSPVRDYLIGVWRSLTSDQQAPVAPPAAVKETPAPEPDSPIGHAVTPAGGRVRIALVGQANGTAVRVTLVDADKARIRASNGTAPRFTIGAGEATLQGGSGEIHIELPRTAAGSIEVDGRVFVTSEGGALRFYGPNSDTVGSNLIRFQR